MPRTLFARGMMIVVLPVILMQLVTIYIFFERHLDNVNRYASQAFVSEVSFLTYLVARPENRQQALSYLQREQTDITAKFYAGRTMPHRAPSQSFAAIEAQLAERIELPLHVIQRGKQVEVGVQLEDGLLLMRASVKRIQSPTVDIFVLWVSISGILLTVIALVFLRNQIRPIKELAEVAERFGKGQDVGNFKPSGATEVRRAGRAFLVMRERIARQVKSRTDMLAGISHDLRTPLTRMKLELALLKDTELRSGLEQDVEQMQHMIGEYLDFTHGVQPELGEPVLLTDIAHELQQDYARGEQHLALDIPDDLQLNLRLVAFRRMLTNMIDNAFRYGGRCQLSARRTSPNYAEIYIEDDGSGIPSDKYEEVLRPFTRLDPARNLNTSGVGLGLAVAQDIAMSHGGRLELGTSALGGLKVVVRLPV